MNELPGEPSRGEKHDQPSRFAGRTPGGLVILLRVSRHMTLSEGCGWTRTGPDAPSRRAESARRSLRHSGRGSCN